LFLNEKGHGGIISQLIEIANVLSYIIRPLNVGYRQSVTYDTFLIIYATIICIKIK